MDKKTKLTLAELLKRKEQIIAAKKTKKTQNLYVNSLGAIITIEEPEASLCRDVSDMEAGEGDKYMCYECIKEPDLKSKEVQDAFGCAVPMDIVEMIFAPGEIPQIAVECMKLAGYMDGVKQVKNKYRQTATCSLSTIMSKKDLIGIRLQVRLLPRKFF